MNDIPTWIIIAIMYFAIYIVIDYFHHKEQRETNKYFNEYLTSIDKELCAWRELFKEVKRIKEQENENG